MLCRIKVIYFSVDELVTENGKSRWKSANKEARPDRTCSIETYNKIIRYLDKQLVQMDKAKEGHCYLN